MRKSILTIENLNKTYSHKKAVYSRNQKIEVKNVSFSVYPQEFFGFIGESGCGKSTIANMLLGLLKLTSGKIYFNSREITKLSERKMRKFRKNIQIVFQYTNVVLDPKMTIEELLKEPLLIHRIVGRNFLIKRLNVCLNWLGLRLWKKPNIRIN